MLTLNDRRNELWQWDTNRKLTVDAECSQVHFSNKVFGRSIDVDVTDGVATIPDILLQTDKELTAWAFVGTPENGYTKISKTFKVNKRNKPADYVFTPTEQTTLGGLIERLDRIEESQDPDAIKNAVEDYLEQNPVKVPVQSVNGYTGKVKLTAEDVGAISQDDLQEATNEVLAKAKASGEFDGKDGVDGQPGKDGTSATHSWNGTVLTVTSASGTSSADLKGAPGKDGQDGSAGADGVSPTVAVSKSGKVTTVSITDKNGTKTATINDGADGKDGTNGTSVTVKSVSESTADGGSNVVTFSDGKTLTVKNGSKGSAGDKGATGATGKTAYQYAQDGGYTGTEAEFAAKLTKEYNPNPLYGKKVSFLGDSICAGSSDTYVGGYGKIIADRNGMVYENVAHAGATVTAETYSRTTGNAKPWLCRMVENMSADADYAIIEGGLNDGWDETVLANIGSITTGYDAELDDTTYYGAFESMLKQLVTKFKGKKVGYIAVPKMMDLYDSNRNAPNFYHIALECCAKWGVPVCDLNTIIPPFEYLKTLGTDYTADGTHPTYEGYIKYYCDPIEAWLKTLTTGGNVSTGALPSDLDDKYVSKNDISIKKAQLTLEDGSTVLIDVVVASAGTSIQTWQNLVPTSIDTDGSIFNGVGYQQNYRLSSSGAAKEQAGCVVTGFIPAVGGDEIRMAGVLPWYQSSHNNNYLCAYDSSFNFVGAVYSSIGGFSYTKNIAANYELGDIVKVTLASGMNIAYIRASWPGFTAESVNSNADLIITVNQEITE